MSLRHFRIKKPIHTKKEKKISLRKYLEDTLTGAQPFRDAHKLSLEELKKEFATYVKIANYFEGGAPQYAKAMERIKYLDKLIKLRKKIKKNLWQ